MFNKIILYFVFFTLSKISFSQEHFAITTTFLNLRSENTIKSNILTVVKKNDTVKILEEIGNWNKVEYKKITGYLSSSYLTPIEINNTTNESINTFSKKKLFNFLFPIIIAFSIIYYLYRLISRRCNHCGKFGSLKEVGQEILNTKPTKIKERIRKFDSKGKEISSREVLVNATTTTYKVYYVCSSCKQESSKIKEKTRKN